MTAPGLRRGAGGLWTLAGDLSLDVVPALREAAQALWEDGARQCVDLSAVGRIDSAAVALLLEWQRMAARKNVRLTFRNVPRQLLCIAEVCGVRPLLAVEE